MSKLLSNKEKIELQKIYSSKKKAERRVRLVNRVKERFKRYGF